MIFFARPKSFPTKIFSDLARANLAIFLAKISRSSFFKSYSRIIIAEFLGKVFITLAKSVIFLRSVKKMLSRNLLLINEKIKKACKLYRRNVAEVNLIAVSKIVAAEKIEEAIKCGVKIFGENYIKEAKEKWQEIRAKNSGIKLHFIGNLQSNKAAKAVELFDCIETLDNEKLALALQKEMQKQQKNPEIFIQINIGEEPQKGGIMPQDLKNFTNFCRKNHLNITGLMCIPPLNEAASPYFALLAKLAKENNLKNLSMGMSSDFEEAIALGATHIRLGTAIFGERKI